MLLYIDVETIPSQAEDARDLVRKTIRPPATHKKAETIAAWWANEADLEVEAQWRRQSLDGGTLGEIASIAIVDDHGREWVLCRYQGQDEAELLRLAFDAVQRWTVEDAEKVLGDPGGWPVDDHHPVAHNAAFDLGFLWRRATVHGVPRPKWLPGPMARPGRDFTCTMQTWAGFGKTVALDTLCRSLGVPSPKGELDGSKVFDAWLAGDYKAIEAYNVADARAVREIHHRILGLPRAA
jgi:hypothetical protein